MVVLGKRFAQFVPFCTAHPMQDIFLFAFLDLLELLVQCADLFQVWLEFRRRDFLYVCEGDRRDVSCRWWFVRAGSGRGRMRDQAGSYDRRLKKGGYGYDRLLALSRRRGAERNAHTILPRLQQGFAPAALV